MRQLHERADASSRRDARKGEHARDGGRAPDAPPTSPFFHRKCMSSERRPRRPWSASNALAPRSTRHSVPSTASNAPASKSTEARVKVKRTTSSVGSIGWIGGIDRGEEVGSAYSAYGSYERKTANGERFRVRGGRDLVEDRRLGLDRRSGVVRQGRIHLREHGNVVGLRAVEVGRGSVGVRERGRSVGTNRTRNEEEEQHIARMEPRADDDELRCAARRTVDRGREGGPSRANRRGTARRG